MLKIVLIFLVFLGVATILVADWNKIAFKNLKVNRWSNETRIYPNEVTDYNIEVVNKKYFL